MKREVKYEWHIRELMARNKFKNSKELVEPLRMRGITLSPLQIWRIVEQEPERVSLQVLCSLADIFGVQVNELISYTAVDASQKRTKKASGEYESGLRNYRPGRAQILPDEG